MIRVEDLNEATFRWRISDNLFFDREKFKTFSFHRDQITYSDFMTVDSYFAGMHINLRFDEFATEF